jgi:C-terminal processing protease CtpA/Prc
LDLRWAGGDSLADLAHVASRYAATGELLCEVQSLGGRTIEQLSALPGARGADQNSPPTVVLVGPETRGAAEVLVALLDRRRGVMTIGRDTAHDLPIRETLVLPDGWSARVATRRIVFPEGGALDARHRFTPRLKLPAQLPPDPEEPEANGDWLDRRKTLPQEEEDRQLRARLRGDPELRSAVDLLLALAALRSAD